AIDFPVIGIFDCPNPYISKYNIFMTYENISTFLNVEDYATEIDIRIDGKLLINDEQLKEIKDTVNGAIRENGKLTAVDWKELAADYLALSQTKKGGTNSILFLIFIIITVGIINTMMMAVFERVNELGMMRSLGMRDRSVLYTFIVEGIGVGFLGSVMGVLAGIFLNIVMIYHGIDLTSLFKDMDAGYRVTMIMRGIWNVDMMIIAIIFVVIFSGLISIIPARRALKMKIVDALRFM
ncbi:MAG: FtsX-like permease family protein, partial [Actinomycetia bacterium]|nr:FtsX-like permease family protein [Actinomycetes bacterium]